MTSIFILTGLLVFGVIHSILAGQGVKQSARRRVGNRRYEAFYRLTYNAIAVLMLAPVLVVVLVFPGDVVWSVEQPLVVWLLRGLQLAGVAGLGLSLLQIDLGRFAGFSQLRAYIAGEALPLPDEPLQEGGLYRLVRHPLYLFSLLALWPMPVMTEALLVFNIAATLYFTIGSRLEERRLVAAFGDQYRRYQRRVPWLIPFVKV